jgi:uncharacterized membrane protein YhhN
MHQPLSHTPWTSDRAPVRAYPWVATIRVALVALVAVGVVGMLVVWQYSLGSRARMMTTVLASTSYVLVALAGGGLLTGYGRLAVAALLLCWLGDLLGPGAFKVGLVAFLLAHLAWIGAFYCRGIESRRFLVGFPLGLCVSAVAFLWVFPHLPPDDVPAVLAYTLVITVMLVTACSSRAGASYRLILLGAMLFYVSDLFVARARYVSPGRINQFVGYPLYYGSCVLLALSVVTQRRESRPGE